MTGSGGLSTAASWLAVFTEEDRGLQSLTAGALFAGVPVGLFGLGVLLIRQLYVGLDLRRRVAPASLAAAVLIGVAAPFVWQVPDDAQGPMPPLYSGDFGAGAFLGLLLAGLALALLSVLFHYYVEFTDVVLWRIGRRLRKRARERLGPTQPSTDWLFKIAVREHRRLSRRLTSRQQAGPEPPPGERPPRRAGPGRDRALAARRARESAAAAREREYAHAWDCLDAATLVLDQRADDRIDPDAEPVAMTIAIALLRSGTEGLRPRGRRSGIRKLAYVCALNPLHGPASRLTNIPWNDGPPSYDDHRYVCDDCFDQLFTGGGGPRLLRTHQLVLRLRPRGVQEARPYQELPSPLAGEGLPQVVVKELIGKVREDRGVF